MEEVAEEGTADRGMAGVGVGAINARCSQTTAAHKVSKVLAEAAVAGDSFHRPWERSLHRGQLLCHLMHGTLPCLS